LRLRWDFVDRQALTLQAARSHTLDGHYTDVRVQWSAAFFLNMRRAILILLLALLTTQNLSASTNTLVLVVRADSKVPDLDSVTVRKLFWAFRC